MRTLRTARLVLREPREEDVDAFTAIASDPESTRYFHNRLDRAESAERLERIRVHFVEHGFGQWVVELPGEVPFIGMVGLARVTFDAPFAPAIEAAWRIARPFWRRGYAREAAAAAIADGFGRLAFNEIVAFTVPANAPSQAVMRSLGMVRNPADDFDHPRLPEGHPLRRHVLYRIRRKG